MKRLTKITAVFLLCLYFIAVPVLGRELVAVGQIVGLELQDGTVTVAAFDEKLGKSARDAGVEVGDVLVSINGRTIHTAEDVRLAMQSSKGTAQLQLRRGSRKLSCSVTPEITEDGPKLGLYLRQGVTGIGTVTWYDPETKKFGTLGHGVNHASGQLLRMTQGTAFASKVAAVRRGKAGEPGQLMGCAQSRDPIGTLTANLPQGVFGISQTGWAGRALQTAEWEDVKTGNATILSTVAANTVQEYSVEILKINPNADDTGRNLLLRITDPKLLKATGGIVQGMSGSPIIQDGKLIGAVTHVLVNDPTRGYGIFIENMLDAAA